MRGERVSRKKRTAWGEDSEAGKRAAVMFLKRKKDLRNIKKTSTAAGTCEQGRENTQWRLWIDMN